MQVACGLSDFDFEVEDLITVNTYLLPSEMETIHNKHMTHLLLTVFQKGTTLFRSMSSICGFGNIFLARWRCYFSFYLQLSRFSFTCMWFSTTTAMDLDFWTTIFCWEDKKSFFVIVGLERWGLFICAAGIFVYENWF